MHQYLYKYLVLHKKLCIPDLGYFLVQMVPAKIDVANDLLFAPHPQIIFQAESSPAADKVFFDFLAKEMGVDLVVAIRQFHDFLYQLRNKLTSPEGAFISGIGLIRKEASGHVLFSAEKNLHEWLPTLQVDDTISVLKKELPVSYDEDKELTAEEFEDIRELLGQEDQADRSDNWWVYAIILLLIGVGALLFYYL